MVRDTRHADGQKQLVEDIGPQVRVMQIIAFSLIAGVVVFGVVIVAMATQEVGQGDGPRGATLSWVGAVVAATSFLLAFQLPALIARSARSSSSGDGDIARWCGTYQTRLIITLALLEGAAFLNLIAFMLERNWWSLAIVGGLVMAMAIQFPTRLKVEHWIETQRSSGDQRGTRRLRRDRID